MTDYVRYEYDNGCPVRVVQTSIVPLRSSHVFLHEPGRGHREYKVTFVTLHVTLDDTTAYCHSEGDQVMKQGVPSAEERDIAQAIDLLNSARSADRVLQEAQGYLRRAAVALQSRPQQAARGVTEPAQEPACDWYGSRQSNHSYVTHSRRRQTLRTLQVFLSHPCLSRRHPMRREFRASRNYGQ